MLNIEGVGYFIPKSKLRIEESLNRFSLSKLQARVFSKFYGIQEISYADGLSLVDLVSGAIEMLFSMVKVNKQQIKYIIHAHTAKVITRFGRSVILEVQQNLGLSNAMVFGTSLNNCASTLNAFEIAEMLLSQETQYAKAIIVAGEIAFTPTLQVIPDVSITGDAAAAALVGLHGQQDIMLGLEIKTAGQFYRGIWLLAEERATFEKIYVNLLSKTILKAVKQAGIELDNITLILPHNVNLLSWKRVAVMLNFPLHKIYLKNISRYAHCFGADILINYADAKKDARLVSGDYYIMVTVGLGATFAAAVFQH